MFSFFFIHKQPQPLMEFFKEHLSQTEIKAVCDGELAVVFRDQDGSGQAGILTGHTGPSPEFYVKKIEGFIDCEYRATNLGQASLSRWWGKINFPLQFLGISSPNYLIYQNPEYDSMIYQESTV